MDIINENDETLSKRHAMDKMKKAYEKFKQHCQLIYKKKIQEQLHLVQPLFNHQEIYRKLDKEYFFEADFSNRITG